MELSTKTESGTYFLYNKSFWTGRKSLTVDGEVATKVAKRVFRVERDVRKTDVVTADEKVETVVPDDSSAEAVSAEENIIFGENLRETVDYTIKGSFITGVSLVSSKNETIVLAKNNWYDWILIFFPLIGIPFGVMFFGAIGSFFSVLFTGLAACVNANVARSKLALAGKIPLQILIGIVANGLWFACWYIIAVLILSAVGTI